MSDYIFEGEVIKLNAKDYYRFADMFKYLNLTEELETLDLELEARKRDGLSVKNWFSSLPPRLNGRNKRAMNQAKWSNRNNILLDEREQQANDWASQGNRIERK